MLQTSVKRQAGVIKIFEENDKASGKRFDFLHSEIARIRGFNKKLVATQGKIATEVRLQMNQLLAFHPDDTTDTDTTEQLDQADTLAIKAARAQGVTKRQAVTPCTRLQGPRLRPTDDDQVGTTTGHRHWAPLLATRIGH